MKGVIVSRRSMPRAGRPLRQDPPQGSRPGV